MQDKIWDIFISHASEDKAGVAAPLAAALQSGGARVWLDDNQLEIGDSLAERIDEGLSSSRYGAVILSPHFFSKHWPRRELAGLRAREEGGHKVILPIWHNIDKAQVASFSPILADALAASTSLGVEGLARQILHVIFSPNESDRSTSSTPLSRLLIEILDGRPPRKYQLLEFLRSHLYRIPHWLSWRDATVESCRLGELEFDAHRTDFDHGTTLTLIKFTDLWDDPFGVDRNGHQMINDQIRSFLESASYLQDHVYGQKDLQQEIGNWIEEDLIRYLESRGAKRADAAKAAREQLERAASPLDGVYLQFVIFAGRRSVIEQSDASHRVWSELRAELRSHGNIQLRSYDHLVAAFIEEPPR